jgi:hypothetical protein
MNANTITALLLLEIPKRFPQVRVWRRNVGAGYPSGVVRQAIGMIRRGESQQAADLLARTRHVVFGKPGEPDIDGFAGPSGLRIGIEIKYGRDKQTDEQHVCERVWREHGAVYIVATDVDKALDQLGDELRKRGAA